LSLIEEKGFTDYFQVIGRMVQKAKENMLVGPARGSAAGSLVCYLMGITDVDPLIHGLMFERFIDITRSEFPDVDIDFPDRKRDDVIDQLAEDWGEDHVGRIGTIARYKPKSALTDVARELKVPPWEINHVKDTITERSSGDERAAFAVADALGDTEVGKDLLKKYPGMVNAGRLEGHARHSGRHAAGVLVTSRPTTTFASIDKSGACQLDKKSAEALDMLKIDCLGLRTLSVLEDALDQIGKDPDWLVRYPLTDEAAFEVLNQEHYAGIFQFEGYALQALCRQMKIREFSDIASITALARPGPLHCGAAAEFVARRLGKEKITNVHPVLTEAAADSFGTVIYQEQVMMVCRNMGQFSWEDVTMIRRIMRKSFGDEFFAKYWEKFKEGATAQGVDVKEAKAVWDKICTFGSWAFNKSHAVSYGLISYWCALLKAHWPLEFGAACLRNAKDDDQALKILRELVEEGYEYRPVDPDHSGLDWRVNEGKLIGGLTNIKGVGPAKAKDIIRRREEGKPLPPGLLKLLRKPETPFDHVFEAKERFGDIYDNPKAYGINSGPVTHVADIQDEGEYVFIAKLRERKLRDENEAHSLAKRGGREIKGRTRFLNLVLEDDTGTVIGKVTRHQYDKWGTPIVEQMATGDYLLFKGKVRSGWRIVYISYWRYIEKNPGKLEEES
jgi:DNA-directed DNA polymerase III PolC